MLSPVPTSRAGRRVRMVQAVLAIVAVVLVLQWFEAVPDPEPIGEERLFLRIDAPVEHPLGPWTLGLVFDETAPGIPYEVAPNATVRATYTAPRLQPSEPSWTFSMRMVEEEDRRVWWERELPVNTTIDGDTATIDLPLRAHALKMLNFSELADVKGDVRLELVVQHEGRIVTTQPGHSDLEARLHLVPGRGNVTLIDIEDDRAAYQQFPPAPLPYAVAAPVGAILLLEIVLAVSRRRWSAWDRYPGVQMVWSPVPVPPPDAESLDLEGLMKLAEAHKSQVFIDRESGLAKMLHPLRAWARLPGADEAAMEGVVAADGAVVEGFVAADERPLEEPTTEEPPEEEPPADERLPAVPDAAAASIAPEERPAEAQPMDSPTNPAHAPRLRRARLRLRR